MASGKTRLDRLVILLETGSSAHIRNAAAQQLADVQKQHPEDLFNLLTRVVPFLRSSHWDARAAAAKAIGGIVENAEKFDPNEDEDPDLQAARNGDGIKTETSEGIKKDEEVKQELGTDDAQLRLDTLDVASILKFGKPLLGSAGKEYDYQFAGMDPADRLAHQKKNLTARLGLGGEYIEEELVTVRDIEPVKQLPGAPGKINTSLPQRPSMPSPSTPHDSTPQTPGANGGLSARQLNALKRRRKNEMKSGSNKVRIVDFNDTRRGSSFEQSQTPSSTQPIAIKTEESMNGENGTSDYFSIDRANGGVDDESKLVTEFKGEPVPEKSMLQAEPEDAGNEWPFDRLCDFLSVDLFDHAWEIRHGAAQGLREIIRVHGAGAGRRRGKSRFENDERNLRFLEDLACRLCCVFMLDRFGDYSSEGVVVPVRETAGQALGSVLAHLPPSAVKAVFGVLRRLIGLDHAQADKVWQSRHGGILGIRYLVAVRNDLLLQEPELLDGMLEAVLKCLADDDDDVRTVSAATLIPVAKEVVTMRPEMLGKLTNIIWDCVSSLSDDLSVSTGSVMDLLAKLCSFSAVLEAMKDAAARDSTRSFSNLVPRLYPFLRHTIPGVRSAVLRALLTFISIQDTRTSSWADGKILRLMFQNLIVERVQNVLALSLEVWNGLVGELVKEDPQIFMDEMRPHVSAMLALLLSPIGNARLDLPLQASLFMRPSGQTLSDGDIGMKRKMSSPGIEPPKKKQRKAKEASNDMGPEALTHNVDGAMIRGIVSEVGADVMIRCRIAASKAMGFAMANWTNNRDAVFGNTFKTHLESRFSSVSHLAASVLEEYFQRSTLQDPFNDRVLEALQKLIKSTPAYYGDLVNYLQVTAAQCRGLFNAFGTYGKVSGSKLPTIAAIVQGEESANDYAFSLIKAQELIGVDGEPGAYARLWNSMNKANQITSRAHIEAARADAETAYREAATVYDKRLTRIQAAAAGALVAAHAVPPGKAGIYIKAIMNGVRLEETFELQQRAANAVVLLIDDLHKAGKVQPVLKMQENLGKYYCEDTAETADFNTFADKTDGIVSLSKDEDVRESELAQAKAARISRRGARDAFERLARHFGNRLFDVMPSLRTTLETPIKSAFGPDKLPLQDTDSGQTIVDAMSLLRALVPHLHTDLQPFMLDLMPLMVAALQCELAVFRYAAAKCLATITRVMPVEGITALVEKVIPTIGRATSVHCRQGATECIYHLIHAMEDKILPYVIFFIVPILGRMSDADQDVRLLATTTFATLIKLVPLEAGISDPPGFSEELLKGRERERNFMAQMLDPKKAEDFEVPVTIKATLRSYQQQGVNWLNFLNRFNLHGILCDDMGLGKTLQTITMVASDHHLRAERFSRTKEPEFARCPTLIVCPPSLSGHWQQEIRTYAPFLSTVAYVGPTNERKQLRNKLSEVDIVITSYNVCLNDNAILSPMNWNYCVLDEGHLIKNSKTKTTLAVKSMKTNHRLILTGTPIQNNVAELWSLFDFLMPGFLGSEKVFQDRFGKPIAASRNAKANSREQEAGALAIEALHKQVLPFLLRRMKEEVLDDLPPKIIQNYYCDLSDLQRKLFQDFNKKEGQKLQGMVADKSKEGKEHIFKALQYMRKLCNAPSLAITPKHKQYDEVTKYCANQKTTLKDPAHAPKLTALRDLLVDCGIGATPSETNDPSQIETVSQHRALIFCQMKEMLDMVQTDVFGPKGLLPSVQYLRMDGSVEGAKRQDMVNRFNSDPSYDCLLLTTSVGGLGLNLTGADTVIFLEHDWNPQKDMQAMDRAHRIGQKKTVNVYRIVTRGTLEEKILSLQRFKMDVASTVVNQQNAGLNSMETDQILDLFNVSASAAGDVAPLPPADSSSTINVNGVGEDNAVDATGAVRQPGQGKSFLDEIGELWDENQYKEEFDIDAFLSTMKA